METGRAKKHKKGGKKTFKVLLVGFESFTEKERRRERAEESMIWKINNPKKHLSPSAPSLPPSLPPSLHPRTCD